MSRGRRERYWRKCLKGIRIKLLSDCLFGVWRFAILKIEAKSCLTTENTEYTERSKVVGAWGEKMVDKRRKVVSEAAVPVPAARAVLSAETQAVSSDAGLRAAKDAVNAAMPTIIEAILKKAKSGSCQHAKFLLDFVKEEQKMKVAASLDEDEESLAELLLREIREAEAEERAAG
ncbi:MAG: hypothetical protein JWO13_1364 [Acidobacteriales bacterium]|nr:hypothetical protein [Terriglobales bacterium]